MERFYILLGNGNCLFKFLTYQTICNIQFLLLELFATGDGNVVFRRFRYRALDDRGAVA